MGQSLVVEALRNSFKQKRTHHAYLFTGTRGVGKTTLARIIAQCFNCEKGITHEPCGKCTHCQALRSHHMIDFIEIDAASRTKVEDTREILENVPYPPVMARFKIYLIDEVHMLSNHSFNALLKTLEEPPAHVIFILATTDPQKLPSTVLSRCLQLHLQPIAQNDIASHLKRILDKEGMTYQAHAITMLAEAAHGSLRDALSLLEQSIALCPNGIDDQHVAAQLGLVPKQHLQDLAATVLRGQTDQAFTKVQTLLTQSVDCGEVLIQLQTLWHQLSVAVTLAHPLPIDSAHLTNWLCQPKAIQCEHAQLLYQIATLARRDFPFSPTPQMGLEMAILRMCTFRPAKTEAPSVADQAPMQSIKEALDTKLQPAPTSEKATSIHAENWGEILDQLPIGGMIKAIFKHCSFISCDGHTLILHIALAQAKIMNERSIEKLRQILQEQGLATQVEIKQHEDAPQYETPVVQEAAKAARHLKEKEASLRNTPIVQALAEAFSGTITETILEDESVPS